MVLKRSPSFPPSEHRLVRSRVSTRNLAKLCSPDLGNYSFDGPSRERIDLSGMPRHLVSYDLNAAGKNYKPLYDELSRLGAKRLLMSQWALRNPANAKQLADHLWQFLDRTDRLLVSNLDGDWCSYGMMTDINTV
jgi:hypothetical protein